jgi:protein-S-isoprenylcysteine O-methyltransferase Ste14
MREKNGEHPLGDSGQLVFLIVYMVVWVADSFVLRLSIFLSSYISIYTRLAIAGLVLIITFYLIMSGHVIVSRKQRPTGIVSTGAFRYVRHPLYLGCVLFYFAVAIATISLFSLALLVVIFFFYHYIANYEERILDERFGEEYNHYKKRTGKWLPIIGKKE